MDPKLVPGLEEIEGMLDRNDSVVPMAEAAKRLARTNADYFPIGFSVFDNVMKGGAGPGDLVVISGISGHGKTTFGQTLSWHFNKIGIPQLWFSYEVDVPGLWAKFIDMGVDSEFLAFCPLINTSGSIEWIERKIREAILKYNTKVVFIDHLGFLSPKISGDKDLPNNLQQNFSLYLGGICRQLKRLAIEKGITIFLMAHVRKTKELGMDDIANSAGIAQESDFVFMVERLLLGKEKKKFQSPYRDNNDEGELFSEESKVMLVKNRRTGSTKFIKCKMNAGRLMQIDSNGNFLELSEPAVEVVGVDE